MSNIDDLLIEKEIIQKDVRDMKNVENKNKLLEEIDKIDKIDKTIIKLCDHDIITDYIDTMFPYREGIMIQYCKNCEISKKLIDLNK